MNFDELTNDKNQQSEHRRQSAHDSESLAQTPIFCEKGHRGMKQTKSAIMLLLRRPFDGWNGMENVELADHGAKSSRCIPTWIVDVPFADVNLENR